MSRQRGAYFVSSPGLPNGNPQKTEETMSKSCGTGLSRMTNEALMQTMITALKEGNAELSRRAERVLRRRNQDCAEIIMQEVSASR